MDIFDFRNGLIKDYADYVRSFIRIRDGRLDALVKEKLEAGQLWPESLIQLNPSFAPGGFIDEVVEQRVLHPESSRIFRVGKDKEGQGQPLRLHLHQAEAIKIARAGHNYVLTTGTGSGKSLTYIVPVVDYVLRNSSAKGIKAIVVYPMNALANSQAGELEKFLRHGYPEGHSPVSFRRYTGQESDEERNDIIANPPDILLTNYVMLELLLTRPRERSLIEAARGLRFLVLDELHTYRGRQGADVAMLVRRVRERLGGEALQVVGTSATMSSKGTYTERQADVTEVATRLFGAPVEPQHVVGETLERTTAEYNFTDEATLKALRERIEDPKPLLSANYEAFTQDPLAAWIETSFGMRVEPQSGRLVRAQPRTLGDAAAALSELTGIPAETAAAVLKDVLLAGYGVRHPTTGLRVFAFRLHQFISRGDTVYASLEPEAVRFLTLEKQQFVPGDRSRVLLPLAFCRECGQDYYTVWKHEKENERAFTPRGLSEFGSESGGRAGYLFVSADKPWPDDSQDALERLPDDWLEERSGEMRVKSSQRKYLPDTLRLELDATESPNGLAVQYAASPLRFCLHCGAAYPGKQNEFGKLGVLSAEGRASATTILSLSATLQLRASSLPKGARKLLSFTDNRQDASLQAGHLNDFVEVSLLRASLYKAMCATSEEGLAHDELTQRVFASLGLELDEYASNPEVKFQARKDTDKALREVLGYRLYRDLKRGWRITAPNLEQTGLLEITYASLDELCEAEEEWAPFHPALSLATPEVRARVAKVLADVLRWNLAVNVDYLNQEYQERIKQQSGRWLKDPWALDDNEVLEYSTVAFPRAKRPYEQGKDLYLSPRGLFGRFLRRQRTFPQLTGQLSVQDTDIVIGQLFKALNVAGIVDIVNEAKDDVLAYRLNAGAMRWRALEGSRGFVDPLRTVLVNEGTRQTNAFFRSFYQGTATQLTGIQAREHTAQVPSRARLEREEAFREAKLPILYCSPTMELGVDIKDLNVVNMRNVPPTPANYAQRSGRAGRSGQPALVFTYSSSGNSHDQYFFKRPHLMVAGVVAPPKLELANEELLRAHVHAVWLAETGVNLQRSLVDILDLNHPDYPLLESIQADITSERARQRAMTRAQQIATSLQGDLGKADWYHGDWLSEVLRLAPMRFDGACNRWRSLYRSALEQARQQDEVIRDASRPTREKDKAKRLRAEAENQMRLLGDVEDAVQSDFYSYRYFASEGFLPGYSFPRLPLSAYVPGRRGGFHADDYLSRPRFLAISEFGPRAVLYHEGVKYEANRVILPAASVDPISGEREELGGGVVKQCQTCGYLHPVTSGEGVDVCERCGSQAITRLRNMFRLENVSTRRRERINSDEEERQRLGYEVISGVRFEPTKNGPGYQKATVEKDNTALATLQYGHAANVWRINLGWLRRENRNQQGFVLDLERGYWGRDKDLAELEGDTADDETLSARLKRVIPYVQDFRNALLWEPVESAPTSVIASLAAALKNAIQVEYQLEDSELAAEPLPNAGQRRLILFYEAAEGGAGVLRNLLDDAGAVARVARQALELCHFDPDTGTDREMAPHASERCEAACYDCLMSYTNQRDHLLLDRHSIKELLLALSKASTRASPTHKTRAQHLEELMRLAQSGLEREFLKMLDARDCRLPSAAQKLMASCGTRPDFMYEEDYVVIYIDGPPHDYPERQARDAQGQRRLEDEGYTVLRFKHTDDWPALLEENGWLFGGKS